MIVYNVRTRVERNNFGLEFFYPIVLSYCKALGLQTMYINEPQTTRYKARLLAKKYIQNIICG